MHSLTKTELLALLKTAKDARQRDWLMILVALNHGLRASEVTQIKRSDIRDGYLTIQRLKGSKKTTQPLLEHPDPLLNERQPMFEFIKNLRDSERVFRVQRRQFYNIVCKYAARAGIPEHKQFAHVLKHTTAMQLINKVEINELQAWLGHKSLSSTGEYLKISDADAAAAIQRAISLPEEI